MKRQATHCLLASALETNPNISARALLADPDGGDGKAIRTLINFRGEPGATESEIRRI